MRRVFVGIVGIVAASFLTACAAFEEGAASARLQGEVRSWPEGALVPHAVVRVKGREVKADARGAYVLEGLGERVSVEVSAPPADAQARTDAQARAAVTLAPRVRRLALAPGETRQVDLWLAPSSGSIRPADSFRTGRQGLGVGRAGDSPALLTEALPGAQVSPSWVEPGRHFSFIQRQPNRTQVWIRSTEPTGPLEPVSRYVAQLPDSASELRYNAAGKRFAFTVAVRSVHLGMGTEIRELDAYTGAMRDLVGGSGIAANPTFSPDGTQLSWARRLATGTWQVWVSGPRGESSRALLATGNCLDPAWSPSGQQMAYVSNLEGAMDIYFTSVELVGSSRPAGIRLTRSPEGGFCRRPVWGRDGEILFESNFHPATGKIQSTVDLYAVKVSSGRIRQVLVDGRSGDW